MAEIKDVKLSFQDSTDPTKKRAKVEFKLVFSETDEGKRYRYDIRLRSEDLPNDEEGPHPSLTLADYTFGFLPERSITAVEGEHSFSHTMAVSKSKLNEDRDSHFVPVAGHSMPNVDDIFAEVKLRYSPPLPFVGFTISQRSPTKILILHGW